MNRSFEEILIEQCAPTLAGVKPANLFRVHSEDQKEMQEIISYWNAQLNQKGIYVRLLKKCRETKSYLIMVYRKHWIALIITQKETQEFLEQYGYFVSNNCDSLLEQLSFRLCMDQEFPHEVGVFLGYPLCDVIGFIQNKGKNYTCCGCWKAYENPIAAKNYFKTLKECTVEYKRMYESGIPIVQLTVSACNS